MKSKVNVADLSRNGDIDINEASERDVAMNAFDVLLKLSTGGKFKNLTPKKRMVRNGRTPTSLDKTSLKGWLLKE